MTDPGQRLAQLVVELHREGKSAGGIRDELLARNLTLRNGMPVTVAVLEGFLRMLPDESRSSGASDSKPIAGDTPDASVSEYVWRPKNERQSVIALAKDVLGDNLDYRENGELFLREDGGWRPNTRLWHVMRAANAVLKRRSEPQILNNPAWEAT